MRGPGDKAPTFDELDAAGYALLEALAERPGLHHYGPLLRETLPQLRDRAALLRPKEISPDYDGPIEPGTIADPAKYAEAIASGVLRELTPEEAAAVQPVLVEVEPG